MGISAFIQNKKNRILDYISPPVLVLLYHRVTTIDTDPQKLAVTSQNFYRHLRVLKNNFSVLRFEDNWKSVKNPSIVITFDDGYADNFLEALPILEELQMPATFFVSTGNIGTYREFWWDDLERIILLTPSLPEQLIIAKRKWSIETFSQRKKLYQDMNALIRTMDKEHRHRIIKKLYIWAGVSERGRQSHRSMSIEELQCLAKSPWVTIGAHTENHVVLSAQTKSIQNKEIRSGKEQIEKWIGKQVDTFSYPFGTKWDYNRDTLQIVKSLGFKKVASNFPEKYRKYTDNYQVPRYLVRNWSETFFEKQLIKWINK